MTRQCPVCGAALARLDGERPSAYRSRWLCGAPACRTRQLQAAGRKGRGRPRGEATTAQPEDTAKVAAAFAGLRFDALRFAPIGAARLPARETHVPTGSSAAWASEA